MGLFMRLILLIQAKDSNGLLLAMSIGLEGLMSQYGYSVLTASFLLVIGIQLFAFSLLFIQNQLYFDEVLSTIQVMVKKSKDK